MSIIVSGVEPKQTFRSLMEYFSGRHVKILSCHEPSVIRVEFGSFLSLAAGNKKGKVDFTILKRNGSSYVNLDFNFLTTYFLGLIVALTTAVLVFAIGSTMFGSIAHITIISGIMALLDFVLVLSIIDYTVSGTEEKMLNELNSFLGSLLAVESRLIRKVGDSNAGS